jgi:hypothetical protein
MSTDYHRENPATCYFARLDFLDKIKENLKKS